MIDRARPVEARRARHVAADHGDRAARGREPGIRGAEEGDDGRPERRGEVGDTGVAAHERVELGEECGEELGTVAPREARRPGRAPPRRSTRRTYSSTWWRRGSGKGTGSVRSQRRPPMAKPIRRRAPQ